MTLKRLYGKKEIAFMSSISLAEFVELNDQLRSTRAEHLMLSRLLRDKNPKKKPQSALSVNESRNVATEM